MCRWCGRCRSAAARSVLNRRRISNAAMSGCERRPGCRDHGGEAGPELAHNLSLSAYRQYGTIVSEGHPWPWARNFRPMTPRHCWGLPCIGSRVVRGSNPLALGLSRLSRSALSEWLCLWGAVAQRLTDGQIPRATIDQLIASARDAQIDASCIHFGKILGELRHRGLSSVGGVTSVKPVYDMLEAEGCPRRAISNQPSIEVGVATGGTFISNGNGFARGTDSFGGILRVDQEPMNFGKRASRWAVL